MHPAPISECRGSRSTFYRSPEVSDEIRESGRDEKRRFRSCVAQSRNGESDWAKFPGKYLQRYFNEKFMLQAVFDWLQVL